MSLSQAIRRRLAGIAALLVAAVAVPAIAQDEDEQGVPDDSQPREMVLEDGTPILLAGAVDANLPDLEAVQASGELEAHLKAYGNLRLGDDARLMDETLIEDGVCRAVFHTGVAVPVISGGRDGVPEREVGFVFFGRGDVEMALKNRHDAERFANHMVMQANRSPEEMRAIAHREQPYTSSFKRAMVLTADRQMADVLRRLDPIGTGTVTSEMRLDDETRVLVEELVVTAVKGEMKARAQARTIFPARSRLLRRSGFDTVDILQYDRMVHDMLGEPWRNTRMISEFQTEDRFHVVDKRKRDNPDDRWLTCFRDGLDHHNDGLYATAFAHGYDSTDSFQFVRFAGERFGPRPNDGAPVPDQRVEAVFGKASVLMRPQKRFMYLRPKVHSEITLRAVDDNVRHVLMKLPRDEAIQGTFKITKLETLSGQPVDFLELDALQSRGFSGTSGSTASTDGLGAGQGSGVATDQNNRGAQSENLTEATGVPQELLVLLPEPLNLKDEVTLVIEWEAKWNLGAWQLVQGNQSLSGQSNAYRPAGSSTGPKRFLPELLPESGGTPWDFEVEVGIPPRKLDVAMSGDTARTRVDEGGWTWTTSKARDMRKPSVAAGIWAHFEEPGAAGLPGIQVHLFPTYKWSLEEFGPEIRRILIFLRRFMAMPQFYELDVYQGRTQLKEDIYRQGVNQAAGGMVGIATIKTGERVTSRSELEDENKFRAQSDLAQQMTTQVWGQVVTPASGADSWMIQAISDSFGMFYVRAALGEEGFNAFEGRLEFVREQLEDPRETVERQGQVSRQDRFMSLTTGGAVTDSNRVLNDYGFYVLARMLRERIGDYAFFSALDHFSERNRGQLVTTADLQAAFEKASGQDLDPFFSYWIRGGFVPKVTLEYSLIPDSEGTFTVDGCVVTDIPFGRFDLPVGIYDQDGERQLGGLIDVVDGRGRFSVDGRGADTKLEADPFGLILSYGRDVKKVDQTTCAAENGDRWGTSISGGPLERDADPEVDYDRTGGEGGELPDEGLEDATKRKRRRSKD